MIKKKKTKLLKGEKILYLLISFLILGNIFGTSFSMALLSKTNIEVESMKKKISKQANLNQSLEMKINELASLENVETVADAHGLGYNNNNIVVIED